MSWAGAVASREYKMEYDKKLEKPSLLEEFT